MGMEAITSGGSLPTILFRCKNLIPLSYLVRCNKMKISSPISLRIEDEVPQELEMDTSSELIQFQDEVTFVF